VSSTETSALRRTPGGCHSEQGWNGSTPFSGAAYEYPAANVVFDPRQVDRRRSTTTHQPHNARALNRPRTQRANGSIATATPLDWTPAMF
jgi:hypothetical protein